MEFYERIIEEFGGYEKCKEILSQPNIDFIMNAGALREHLLRYRRANNIFEVRDKVVRCDGDIDFLFNIENHKLLKVKVSSNQFNNELWSSIYLFRHATDEEIAAGHRL